MTDILFVMLLFNYTLFDIKAHIFYIYIFLNENTPLPPRHMLATLMAHMGQSLSYRIKQPFLNIWDSKESGKRFLFFCFFLLYSKV